MSIRLIRMFVKSVVLYFTSHLCLVLSVLNYFVCRASQKAQKRVTIKIVIHIKSYETTSNCFPAVNGQLARKKCF